MQGPLPRAADAFFRGNSKSGVLGTRNVPNRQFAGELAAKNASMDPRHSRVALIQRIIGRDIADLQSTALLRCD